MYNLWLKINYTFARARLFIFAKWHDMAHVSVGWRQTQFDNEKNRGSCALDLTPNIRLCIPCRSKSFDTRPPRELPRACTKSKITVHRAICTYVNVIISMNGLPRSNCNPQSLISLEALSIFCWANPAIEVNAIANYRLPAIWGLQPFFALLIERKNRWVCSPAH